MTLADRLAAIVTELPLRMNPPMKKLRRRERSRDVEKKAQLWGVLTARARLP